MLLVCKEDRKVIRHVFLTCHCNLQESSYTWRCRRVVETWKCKLAIICTVNKQKELLYTWEGYLVRLISNLNWTQRPSWPFDSRPDPLRDTVNLPSVSNTRQIVLHTRQTLYWVPHSVKWTRQTTTRWSYFTECLISAHSEHRVTECYNDTR